MPEELTPNAAATHQNQRDVFAHCFVSFSQCLLLCSDSPSALPAFGLIAALGFPTCF